MMKNKKNKRNKRDLLNKQVCAGLTTDDKLALRDLRNREGTSYAALIRNALYTTYPKTFGNREV